MPAKPKHFASCSKRQWRVFSPRRLGPEGPICPFLRRQQAYPSTASSFASASPKGAFAELRAACVRRGGDLTGEFLDLEREIDSFASQYDDRPTVTQSVTIRMGKLAGLDGQLALIEKKATALREKAFERFSGSVAARGPFATAEAEALIGVPAPPVSAPKRRSWLHYWFGFKAAGSERG
jgi:hypothetical protein